MTADNDDIFASARGPLEPRPFPIAPLLAAAHVSMAWKLGEMVSAANSTIAHAEANGLTWHQADVWACRIGRHPSELWPVLWWSTCPRDDDEPEQAVAA